MADSSALSALRLQQESCDNRNIPQLRNTHNAGMDIAQIRKGLEKPGKSQRGLAAALGIDPSAVNRMLAGTRQLKLSEVPKVEAYLNEKFTGHTQPDPPKGPSSTQNGYVTLAPGGVVFDRDLPRLKVMGMVETGPDGWSLFNGEVIDTIPRPAQLAGAKDAYAVYIVGTSMEPRYFAGEAVLVHPGKPITVGAFVLVQLKPKADGDAPRAILKRLARRSGSKVVLEQYAPAKTFDLKADDILSMHRVVGSLE